MHRDYHRTNGAVLISAGLFALVILLLILISIPVVRDARARDQSQACVENLNQISAAKERYALNRDLKKGAPIGLQELIKDGKVIQHEPICPAGGKYSVNALEIFPTCSLGGNHILRVPIKRP